MITWSKSTEGFVTSKCGRFQIKPKFWGRVRATEYLLKDTRTGAASRHDTQRAAKIAADRIHP
jgi:hypothetical protein